jgi:hypothetical protein
MVSSVVIPLAYQKIPDTNGICGLGKNEA